MSRISKEREYLKTQLTSLNLEKRDFIKNELKTRSSEILKKKVFLEDGIIKDFEGKIVSLEKAVQFEHLGIKVNLQLQYEELKKNHSNFFNKYQERIRINQINAFIEECNELKLHKSFKKGSILINTTTGDSFTL